MQTKTTVDSVVPACVTQDASAEVTRGRAPHSPPPDGTVPAGGAHSPPRLGAGPCPQGSLPRSLRGLGALAPSIPWAGQTPSSMVIMELSHLQGRTWRPRRGLRPSSARTSPRSHSCDLRHSLPFSVPPFPSLRNPIRSRGGHPEEFLVKREDRNSWP